VICRTAAAANWLDDVDGYNGPPVEWDMFSIDLPEIQQAEAVDRAILFFSERFEAIEKEKAHQVVETATGIQAAAGVGEGQKLALLLMRKGKFSDAAIVLEKVLPWSPYNDRTMTYLAVCKEALLKPEYRSSALQLFSLIKPLRCCLPPRYPLSYPLPSFRPLLLLSFFLSFLHLLSFRRNELVLQRKFNLFPLSLSCKYRACEDIFYNQPRGYGGFMPHKKEYTDITTRIMADMYAYADFNTFLGRQEYSYLRTLSKSMCDVESAYDIGCTGRTPYDAFFKFLKDDIAILRGLLEPFEWKVLQKHYRDEIWKFIPENNDKYTHSASSDRIGYFMNTRLRPVMEFLAGEALRNTYSYTVQYLGLENNRGLKPHIDQVDNEFTVTTAVDWTPDNTDPWTIFFDPVRQIPKEVGPWQKMPDQTRVIPAVLDGGDSMLFRGRQHTHYRHPLMQNRTSTNMLSHYVKWDYPIDMRRDEHGQKVFSHHTHMFFSRHNANGRKLLHHSKVCCWFCYSKFTIPPPPPPPSQQSKSPGRKLMFHDVSDELELMH
jgi:hypothetical protein